MAHPLSMTTKVEIPVVLPTVGNAQQNQGATAGFGTSEFAVQLERFTASVTVRQVV